MSLQVKLLSTAQIYTAGGREGGTSRSSDGNLGIRIAPPSGHGDGTNPEQLFAAGRKRITLKPGFATDAAVDLSLVDGDYTLDARLHISSRPGSRDRSVARR